MPSTSAGWEIDDILYVIAPEGSEQQTLRKALDSAFDQ